MKRFLLIAFLAVGLLLTPIHAHAGSPRVITPSAHPHGATYGEWAAEWWQWALAQPTGSNPVLDTTGAACANGQSGPVWFLAGTSGGGVERNCAVPPGTTLFIPIINAVVSTADFPSGSEEDLRAGVEAIMDDAADLIASVDGVPIAGLAGFRAQSQLFVFTVPTDNLIGAAAGTYEGVADGFWLMLAPLPSGTHTIEFEGELPSFGFGLDVTYHLTVGR